MIMRWIPAAAALALFASCDGPDRKVVLDRAQAQIEPVMMALTQYRDAHRRYPAALNDLLSSGTLSALPSIPKVRGTSGDPRFRYEVSDDGSIFYIAVAYDFPSGFAPGDIVARYYRSDEGHWGTSKYPPSLSSERELKERQASKP